MKLAVTISLLLEMDSCHDQWLHFINLGDSIILIKQKAVYFFLSDIELEGSSNSGSLPTWKATYIVSWKVIKHVQVIFTGCTAACNKIKDLICSYGNCLGIPEGFALWVRSCPALKLLSIAFSYKISQSLLCPRNYLPPIPASLFSFRHLAVGLVKTKLPRAPSHGDQLLGTVQVFRS